MFCSWFYAWKILCTSFFYTKFGRILFTCSFDPLGFNWILVIQVGVSAPNFAVGKADSKFF
jgi:hypothetical protein